MSVSSNPAPHTSSGNVAGLDLAGDNFQTLTEIERHILRELRQLRYGAIEVVVHEGRVMQIEKSQKLRFDTKGRPLTDSKF